MNDQERAAADAALTCWMEGHISALRLLASNTKELLELHHRKEAAEAIQQAIYALNRADNCIRTKDL